VAARSDPQKAPSASPPAGDGVQVLESTSLFRGAAEVIIRHEGRTYRLRRTRLGKLILTA